VDEFVIVLNDPGSDTDIEKIKVKIRSAFDGPINVDGHQVVLNPSVACAVCPSDGETAGQLLDKGDKRMYSEKRVSKISVADATV
jgi:GGDEF domain-containing protein